MLDCFVDFSALLTSHEEIFLGKPEDFKAFHNSFGLPVHSFNLFSRYFFLLKMNLCTLHRAALYNSLSICNLDLLKIFNNLSQFLVASEISPSKHFWELFYWSFFDRCYLINCNHNFLNEVFRSFSSVIKILVVWKVYTSQSFLKKIN